MSEHLLLAAPKLLSSTNRLIRVHERLVGLVLSELPLYLPSHWRGGRNLPCTRPLLSECPWCAATPLRHHGYLGIMVYTQTSPSFNAIVELPAGALLKALATCPLHSIERPMLIATRRHKKAPIDLTFDNDDRPDVKHRPQISPRDILRTLAKVYSLPDPDAYTSDEAWSLALRARVYDPAYSPARTQPPAD